MSFESALRVDPAYLPALYGLANADLRDADPARARARYETILELDSEEFEAMMGLAVTAESSGQRETAIRFLHKARAVGSDKIEQLLVLVDLYLRVNLPEIANDIATDLQARNRAIPAVPEALGRTQVALGEPRKARVTFSRMARLVLRSPPALHRVALFQLGVEDLDGARFSLTQALLADPHYIPAKADLARLEAQAGNFERAMQTAIKLRKDHPESAAGDITLGDVLMRAQRFSEALDAYLAAQEKQPSSQVMLRIFQARWHAGEVETAVSELATWVNAHPGDAPARRALAAAYIRVNDYPSAIEQHQILLEAQLDDPRLLNNLAWLYHQSGDSRALIFAEKAFALAPDDAGVLDTLGWIMVREEPAQALTYLRDAHIRASKNPDVRYHLAVALNEVGLTEEARRELEDLVESGQEFEALAEARKLLQRLSGG